MLISDLSPTTSNEFFFVVRIVLMYHGRWTGGGGNVFFSTKLVSLLGSLKFNINSCIYYFQKHCGFDQSEVNDHYKGLTVIKYARNPKFIQNLSKGLTLKSKNTRFNKTEFLSKIFIID